MAARLCAVLAVLVGIVLYNIHGEEIKKRETESSVPDAILQRDTDAKAFLRNRKANLAAAQKRGLELDELFEWDEMRYGGYRGGYYGGGVYGGGMVYGGPSYGSRMRVRMRHRMGYRGGYRSYRSGMRVRQRVRYRRRFG